jgi:hypothetical protein
MTEKLEKALDEFNQRLDLLEAIPMPPEEYVKKSDLMAAVEHLPTSSKEGGPPAPPN